MNGNTYFGYYVMWLQQFINAAAYFTLFTVSLTFYIGAYMYINAMALDLRTMIIKFNGDFLLNGHRLSNIGIWSVYIDGINIHNDIMEYNRHG